MLQVGFKKNSDSQRRTTAKILTNKSSIWLETIDSGETTKGAEVLYWAAAKATDHIDRRAKTNQELKRIYA
ncbi:MAG: hypothetical protein ACI9QQ_000051 [Myxococcota bacterium]|jgi:hypothetical protein